MPLPTYPGLTTPFQDAMPGTRTRPFHVIHLPPRNGVALLSAKASNSGLLSEVKKTKVFSSSPLLSTQARREGNADLAT